MLMFLYCSGHFFSAPCLCAIYPSCISTVAAELHQAAVHLKTTLRLDSLRGLKPGRMQTQHTAKHLNPPTDRWTSATYINGACMPPLDTQELLTWDLDYKLSSHKTALGLYTHHKLTRFLMALHHRAYRTVSCPIQLSWEQLTGSSVMKVECYNDLF